jgi:hypothetical protein
MRLAVLDAGDLARLVRQEVASGIAQTLGEQTRDLQLLREAIYASQGLLTKPLAARLLDVEPATLMQYVRRGGLRCYRPGKAPLFLLTDIVDWMRQHGADTNREDAAGSSDAAGCSDEAGNDAASSQEAASPRTRTRRSPQRRA